MTQLKQEITLLSGIGQLSTTLLGTGLFMIPAIAAGIAGQLSLLAWLVLFIAICPIALTFAALGKRYPNAGGTAYFVRQAFGQRLETAVAWLFVSVIPVGIPAAIALAGGFAQQLLPAPLNAPLSAQFLTVVLLIIVNLLGSKSSGRLQTVIALSILALVSAFIWKADIGVSDVAIPSVGTDSMWAIGSALAVMFWCFVGIEAFAHMGEEFKNPQRDFPIAIIIGCFVAGLVYWACSVVILKLGAYGSAEFDATAIPWVTEQLFGTGFKTVISILGFFACFSFLFFLFLNIFFFVRVSLRLFNHFPHCTNQEAACAAAVIQNNAIFVNVSKFYESKGEKVIIEIVAYGPGLHMLRSDTSPVKARVEPMSLGMDNISFAACGNTMTKMAKKEGNDIPIMSEAKHVTSGVVRLIELQEGGYSYLRP